MTAKDSLEDTLKAIRKWARASQSESSIRSAISMARTEEPVAVRPEIFDRDQWKLNLANGILDLKSGTLDLHQRDFYMTMMAGVSHDALATCPRFLEFLDRNCGGRQELMRFKQRLYGSALTGSVRDQKVFIFHGVGANGKSVELSLFRTMLGDYACQTPSDTMIKRRAGSATNDLARLNGKRMVVANETEGGDRLAAALLKQISGGEPLSARFLHHEYKEFQPTCKLFIGTNHLPDIDGADMALVRRLVLIPFDTIIPEHERDPDLKEKLLAEAPGILNWMIEGCLDWQANGLQEPDCVRQTVEAYRADSDPVGAWIEDCCELGEFQTAAGTLWGNFRTWCLINGHAAITMTRFGTVLGQKGFNKVKSGKTYRAGLRPRLGRRQ